MPQHDLGNGWIAHIEERAQSELQAARSKVEAACAALWRVHLGGTSHLTPWRVFMATLAAQTPIDVVWSAGMSRDGEKLIPWTAYTDGSHIRFNAAQVVDWQLETVIPVLLHELEHIARFHVNRLGDKDPRRWNIATDAVINALLDHEHMALPANCVRLSDVTPESLEEDVYAKLPQESGDGGQQNTPQNGPPDLSRMPISGEGDVDYQQVQDRIIAAAYAAASIAGKLPGHIEQWLDARRRVCPPWRASLRRLVSDSVSRSRSWQRLGRRSAWMQCPVPGRDKRPQSIGIVIDTSGSMSDDMLADVIGTVKALASGLGCSVTVWQCDTAVHEPDRYPDPYAIPNRWRIMGRGGTCMTTAAEAVAKERLPIVLWMTDGYWADTPTLPSTSRHVCVLIGDNPDAPRVHGAGWFATVRIS